jgi:hypothetical protein
MRKCGLMEVREEKRRKRESMEDEAAEDGGENVTDKKESSTQNFTTVLSLSLFPYSAMDSE